MASSNPKDAVHAIAESSLTPNPQLVAVPTATTISVIPLSIGSYSLQITQHKLNGRNFQEWFQSVKLVIKGKGKFGYLSGDISSPPKDTIEYQRWEAENSIIMAWLINSMEPKIGGTCLFYQTAKEIWDVVQEIFLILKTQPSVLRSDQP